jgi:hypothetical protein
MQSLPTRMLLLISDQCPPMRLLTYFYSSSTVYRLLRSPPWMTTWTMADHELEIKRVLHTNQLWKMVPRMDMCHVARTGFSDALANQIHAQVGSGHPLLMGIRLLQRVWQHVAKRIWVLLPTHWHSIALIQSVWFKGIFYHFANVFHWSFMLWVLRNTCRFFVTTKIVICCIHIIFYCMEISHFVAILCMNFY